MNAFVEDEPIGLTVEGNVTAANVIHGNASAGIANFSHVNGSIIGDTVENNGRRNAAGNGIGVQLGPLGVTIGTRMLIEDNEIHGNAGSGIELRSGVIGNQVLNKNAADNAVVPASGEISPTAASMILSAGSRTPTSLPCPKRSSTQTT